MKLLVSMSLTALCIFSMQGLAHANQICESRLVARSSADFLGRASAQYPKLTLDQILNYHLTLKAYEQGVLQTLKKTPYFEAPKEGEPLRQEMQRIFENAQNRLVAENSNSPLLRHIQNVLDAQQNYLNWLVTGNIRFVLLVANQHHYLKLEADDLIQSGFIGVKRAALKFDPERNTEFSTYAVYWISLAMRQANSKMSNTIRIPHKMRESVFRYQKAKAVLFEQLGHSPSPAELAKVLKISEKKIRHLEKTSQVSTLPLDATVNGRDETLLNFLPSPEAGAFSLVSEKLAIQKLMDLGKLVLSPSQYKVLALRLGQSESGIPLELLEIADQENYSRQAAHHAEKTAIKKLKAAIEGRKNEK